MSSSAEAACPAVRPVTISYSDIKDRGAALSLKIEQGFGPNDLGIITISDVPGYPSLCRSLLHLSPRLANLPEETKKEFEDHSSRYIFGWSNGKEKLEFGKPDMSKRSFYANPLLDVPTMEESLITQYPSYCGSNIWPTRALPELELGMPALNIRSSWQEIKASYEMPCLKLNLLPRRPMEFTAFSQDLYSWK